MKNEIENEKIQSHNKIYINAPFYDNLFNHQMGLYLGIILA